MEEHPKSFFRFLSDHRVDFREDIYAPNTDVLECMERFLTEGYAERFGGPQSGGTAMCVILALHAVYSNKNAYIFTPRPVHQRHIVLTAREFKMGHYDVQTTNKLMAPSICLMPHTTQTRKVSTACELRDSNPNRLKGTRLDGNVFIDEFKLFSDEIQEEIVMTIRGCLSGTDGGLLINY